MTARPGGDGSVRDLVAQVETLIARAAALDAGDLRSDVIEHVGLVFADTIGVISAGARSSEVGRLVRDPVFGLGRQPTGVSAARVLGPVVRYGDPATVAWINGTSGTFLELDEGYRPTGHPAIHVLPAALAVAESVGASGLELAAAIVAGYEVAARLFESFVLPRPMHPHGHFGAIGAAVAVAKLKRVDPVALAGLAATQPLLTGWNACFEGATARNTWSGHANRVGVLADTLHRSGFTGSLSSHLSVVAPYVVSEPSLRERVDRDDPRIRRNYFKFHSACALTHSALDALRVAWAELARPDPRAVRRIEVTTVSANLRVDRRPEANALSTRFSLPYAMAAALITGSTEPASFEWDERIASYATRVAVTADPAMDARWPASAPARVRIQTADETAEATVDNPHGHHARPATREELLRKFSLLCANGADGDPARVFDGLADLRRVTDCTQLPLPMPPLWLGSSQAGPGYVI